LAIHWRIRRAWLRWGRRKGEGEGEAQGRGWGGRVVGEVGEREEGDVEVALVSELDESGDPRGGEGGEKVFKWGREERHGCSSELLRYGRKDDGGERGGDGSDIFLLLLLH